MGISKVIALLIVLKLSEALHAVNLTAASQSLLADVHSHYFKSKPSAREFQTASYHNSTSNTNISWGTVDKIKAAAPGMCTNSNDCVPWTKCDQMCVCKCANFFDGILKCEKPTSDLSVLGCHCMTYNNKTNTIEAGACVENCFNVNKKLSDQLYHNNLLPNYENITSLNKVMCEKRFNRDGRLCGKCLPGYSPQAYSFNLTCVNCTEGNRNIWKYFIFSLAPLTCFYFFVLFFKINTTSSHLHGFVLFAQSIALPQFARLVVITLQYKKSFDFPIKLLGSFYGFWNLDFFRTFNLGICLNMSPLSVRALDYGIAVYPFILTIVSYVLIQLHDRNNRIVVFMWKPFRCIFTLFRRNWDIRTSVIDAYATFYVLSCFKFLCITFDFLTPAYVHSLGKSNETKKLVVYYDGTIDYFGPEHLPYAIPALLIAFIFVVLPIVLLLVYPCRFYQRLLNRCHIHSHILQTFMDSFQGSYKDGTEPGTRDCRYFAGIHLLARVIAFIVFSLTVGTLYYPLTTVGILLMVIVLANAQPHKANVAHYNNINMTFLCLLAVYYSALTAVNIASVKAELFINGCYELSLVVCFIPLIYMSCISIHWIFSRRRWGRTILNRVCAWRRGYDLLEESLPDRLVNQHQYPDQNMEATAKVDESEQQGGIDFETTY